MTLQEYVASLQGRTVAVVGIGVSNTPLIRLLLDSGIIHLLPISRSNLSPSTCSRRSLRR